MITLPAVGVSEPRQQTEQSAFAAARRTHDGDELPGRQFQIDAAQNLHAMRSGVDGFGNSAGLEDRHTHLLL